ncbi:MAG: GAF domain-containing protein, partial [Pedobacter sp.]
EIKKVIEYDRVMIYKFLEDGHGEVVAEVKNDDLEPFFGLHYPASDIPQQARALYKLNFTRIIADVNTSDSAIATFTNAPLDLTHSALRAVSPIHIQYLKNMGVSSSFSISLIVKGELWGLIACHNYSPKFIDYKAREGAKLIGQILSSGLESRQSEEDLEQEALLKDNVSDLVSSLEKDHNLISALTMHEKTILEVTKASGAAILFEGSIVKVGVTPEEEELTELFSWLKATMKESLFHTSQLSEIFGPARKFAGVGSGIIAAMLSKELGEFIIWFKPEKLKTVNWAGNPDKPVEIKGDGLSVISPRHSFESWAQIVKHTSDKWSQTEISSVIKIREKVVSVINKKANEIRVLNDRLKSAYEELDTFSYTISHDLRTPLTSIKSYTELFLAQNQSLDDRGKKLLDRVVNGADKMGFLINEILKLARVGRSDIDFVKIDMGKMIPDIVTEVVSSLGAQHVKIDMGGFPELQGDSVLLTQVFTNLIGNAVKYSAKSENPIVSVSGELLEDEILYTIKDNGIGIDVNYHDKVFELFKRMENVKDFEGTGVGLAIVKRILEKHNARIWFESELNVGTTFYVAFKR